MTPYTTDPLIDQTAHHDWLAAQTGALLDFYRRGCPDPVNGGFWWLNAAGEPDQSQGKQLWINARMIYTFAVGSLLGHPGCDELVDHGLDYLRTGPLRDVDHGGWFWALGENDEPNNDTKQAYGHAFVLLASTAAQIAGHESSDLFTSVDDLLEKKFWDDDAGLLVDTWNRGLDELEAYRGQNANMHMVEALMLATEATGQQRYLDRALRIAEGLISKITANNNWLLPEHYDTDWNFLPDYGLGDSQNIFRPYGSTVGHWLEWSKLLLQLHHLVGDRAPWIPEAAKKLFTQAIDLGWDSDIGGFIFSTDWNGRPHDRDRYHWVITEAIGAAVSLYRATGDRDYDQWYRKFWDFAAETLIEVDGSWRHQLAPDNTPSNDAWDGKPDLYHTLQATLFARVPHGGSLIMNLVDGRRHDYHSNLMRTDK